MRRLAAMSSFALLGAAAPARADDAALVQMALAADAAGRFDIAVPPGTDAVAAALVQWDRLRAPAYPATFEQLATFLLVNPGWPAEAVLRARAERAVGAATPSPERLAYFDRYPPQGGGAVYRLAEAYAAMGRPADALATARRAWRGASLPFALEADCLARFGASLTPDDHAARADALLWSRQTAAAQRVLPLLAPDARAWAAARLAAQARTPEAAALLAAVPAAYTADPGLLYDRARFLEASGDAAAARRVLADTPVAPGAVRDPVKWMRYRLELARAAARDGDAQTAFRLAANHAAFPMGRALNDRSLAERDAFTDIEWLAGYTALHALGRPGDALAHFSRYQAGAQSPPTRTKGLYWAARAAEAAGEGAAARTFLGEAAAAGETFYGQLAAERLGRAPALPPVANVPIGTTERAAIAASPLVRAARLLGQAGARAQQTVFLRTAAERAATPGERAALAELAGPLGRPDLPVVVGRIARIAGDPWPAYAYPKLVLGPLLDSQWSITHAIARQESNFDLAARSRAGALGLMQLMPGTARGTADKLGLGFSLSRLTADGPYNLQLGAGYYGQLRAQWSGSDVLAVASYNAGPGNVRKWLALNGDPRLPGTDPLAWIEAIPFGETRSYVQRVLENAVVYDLLRPGPFARRAPLSTYLGKPQPG